MQPCSFDTAPLTALVEQRDLILVTGKGGTGKSTLVAALAQLAAARRGGSLAVEFCAHPRVPEMLPPGSGATALNIDAEEVVGASLTRLLGLPALAGAVLKNRVIRLFIRTSPAIREMIALDELSFVVERCAKRGHPVIVDLPATGHALSFLDTPRAVRNMLRVGPLAQIAHRVEQLLLDPRRTEMVAIALPEELPVNETIELMRRAKDIGLAGRTVVVNQVPSVLLHAGDRAMLDVLHRDDGNTALARFAGTARSELDRLDQARLQIERLKAAVPARVIELPHFLSADSRTCASTLLQAIAS